MFFNSLGDISVQSCSGIQFSKRKPQKEYGNTNLHLHESGYASSSRTCKPRSHQAHLWGSRRKRYRSIPALPQSNANHAVNHKRQRLSHDAQKSKTKLMASRSIKYHGIWFLCLQHTMEMNGLATANAHHALSIRCTLTGTNQTPRTSKSSELYQSSIWQRSPIHSTWWRDPLVGPSITS
jgi:hypothetical protein